MRTGFICTLVGGLCAAWSVTAAAATIDAELRELPDGTVLFSIAGAGEDHDGQPSDDAFNQVFWLDIPGDDLFGSGLDVPGEQSKDLAQPIPFAPGIDIVGLSMQNEGAGGGVDDFVLLLSDVFDFDAPFATAGEAVVQGLDFATLNAGASVQVANQVAELNLTITPVPLPPAALLFLGAAVSLLAGASRRLPARR